MTSRLALFAVIAIGCGLTYRAAFADEHPNGSTVYLTVHEPDAYNPSSFPAPLLERELVRQAFLIAARDELGCATRDVILREDFPERPDDKSAPFEFSCRTSRGKKDFDVEYLLRRRQQSGQAELWRWVFNTDINNPKSLAVLAEKAEALSRSELKDVLTRGGWGKTPSASRASSKVASDVSDLLWSWNEVSVLAGLRRVHAEIRERGESPELLGALAVGYANLGSLTDYYYSASCKAYFARALLYAERLFQKTDQSYWGLWHRAYARMQVGLHNLAADDIIEAKKKQRTATPSRPLPFWTNVLEAFGQGRLSRMRKIAETQPQRRLALYLNHQGVAQTPLDDVRNKAARDLVAVCPDCLRAYDTLGASDVLGIKREAAYEPFQVTGALLRHRLPDIAALAAPVKKLIQAAEPAAENETEIKFRKEIVAELKRAGSPELDSGEPSLSALGHMIDEINFAQLMWRLEFEGSSLAVPTDSTVATFGPLCAEHPYAAYLRAYLRSKSERDAAASELIKHLDLPSFTFKQRTMLAWLHAVMPFARLDDWFQVPGLHSDMIFSDEIRGISWGHAGQPDDRKYNRPYMQTCWNTSNKLPLAIAMRVSRDWARARPQADFFEREYADDATVMNALSQRYFNLKRYDDAERCAKLRIRNAPSYAAYRMLADIYKVKGDRAHWKETLEKSLDLPSEGLEHAHVQNEIARDLMDHQEWTAAVVYADAAAQSYSAWSMLTAARCHEKLKHWKRAEELMRAVSERYENQFLDWMYWCHRTGHGDVRAADGFVRAKVEALGTTLEPNQYQDIGNYYVVTGELDKALMAYTQAYEKGHGPFAGLHAALIADALGKTFERDDLFRQILATQLPPNMPKARGAEHYRHLIAKFSDVLPRKDAKLKLPEIDSIVASASIKDPKAGKSSTSGSLSDSLPASTLPYFVGRFLRNRGDVEGAKTYLIRCAQADDWNTINQVLACQLLREMKVEVPKESETK
jgi:tetratricopeptide (TPR) repeat protein